MTAADLQQHLTTAKLTLNRQQPQVKDALAVAAYHAQTQVPVLGWLLSDDAALDDRIIKTADKQAQLLAVLKDPDIPLHNNDMERAIYWFMV